MLQNGGSNLIWYYVTIVSKEDPSGVSESFTCGAPIEELLQSKYDNRILWDIYYFDEQKNIVYVLLNGKEIEKT